MARLVPIIDLLSGYPPQTGRRRLCHGLLHGCRTRKPVTVSRDCATHSLLCLQIGVMGESTAKGLKLNNTTPGPGPIDSGRHRDCGAGASLNPVGAPNVMGKWALPTPLGRMQWRIFRVELSDQVPARRVSGIIKYNAIQAPVTTHAKLSG